MAMSYFSPAGMPRMSNSYGLPVQPVTRVPEVKSALATRSIQAADSAKQADEAEFQVLGNGDFAGGGSRAEVPELSREPQIDAYTKQRVWSA